MKTSATVISDGCSSAGDAKERIVCNTGTPSHCIKNVFATKSTAASAIDALERRFVCFGKKYSNGTKSPAMTARNTTQPRSVASTVPIVVPQGL